MPPQKNSAARAELNFDRIMISDRTDDGKGSGWRKGEAQQEKLNRNRVITLEKAYFLNKSLCVPVLDRVKTKTLFSR